MRRREEYLRQLEEDSSEDDNHTHSEQEYDALTPEQIISYWDNFNPASGRINTEQEDSSEDDNYTNSEEEPVRDEYTENLNQMISITRYQEELDIVNDDVNNLSVDILNPTRDGENVKQEVSLVYSLIDKLLFSTALLLFLTNPVTLGFMSYHYLRKKIDSE